MNHSIRSCASSLAAALLFCGCAPVTAAESRGEPPEACDRAVEITLLSGVARDAKAGAVLELDDGRVVYISGLDAWPPDVTGRRVRASGTVVTAARLPVATKDASGAWSQGVGEGGGGQTWLDNPRWALEAVRTAPKQ